MNYSIILKVLLLTVLSLSIGCSTQPKFIITYDASWSRVDGLPDFNPTIHSDGCSGGMSAIYSELKFLHSRHGNKLRWRGCCVVHDEAYYYGGSEEEKDMADTHLNSCVTNIIGNDYLAHAMEIAVKIGGGPHLPTRYRWGYGEDFRHVKKQAE